VRDREPKIFVNRAENYGYAYGTEDEEQQRQYIAEDQLSPRDLSS
jgi:hypothetical protein